MPVTRPCRYAVGDGRPEEPSPARRRVAGGVVLAALGLIGASHDTYTTGRIVDAATAVAVGAAAVAVFIRTAVVVRDESIVIRNPVHTREIPWSDVVDFRIGSHRLLGAVCIVDLADGSTEHAWAIQLWGPARAFGPRERRMIDFLNAEAARRRQQV